MATRNATSKESNKISRRKFAASATVVAAGLPAGLAASVTASTADAVAQTQAQPAPAAEAQVQAIMAKYGTRLSEEEKADVRRLVAQLQKTGDALRAFPLDNADEPATVFRIYRSDMQQRDKWQLKSGGSR